MTWTCCDTHCCSRACRSPALDTHAHTIAISNTTHKCHLQALAIVSLSMVPQHGASAKQQLHRRSGAYNDLSRDSSVDGHAQSKAPEHQPAILTVFHLCLGLLQEV